MLNICVDIYDIRLKNARRLMESLGESSGPTAMAEKIGKAQDLVSRLMGYGRTKKNIGPRIARDIENSFGKPRGWLDQIHSELERQDIISITNKNIHYSIGNLFL